MQIAFAQVQKHSGKAAYKRTGAKWDVNNLKSYLLTTVWLSDDSPEMCISNAGFGEVHDCWGTTTLVKYFNFRLFGFFVGGLLYSTLRPESNQQQSNQAGVDVVNQLFHDIEGIVIHSLLSVQKAGVESNQSALWDYGL